MTLWLTIFIVSGSGIILLLLLKLLQEKFRVLFFWPDIRHHVEVLLKKWRNRYVRSFTVKNFYIVLHFVVYQLKKLVTRMNIWLDKRSLGLIKLIRGKHHLESRGKSSYFLTDIASFKNRFRK